ncbi:MULTISPECIES: hypothetical protein [unclassified Campylobacter]|uniref:hypothetical protein n=1 Tax=unclassified Campylobacter TaxID=2593542 RepID=UPI0022E9D3D9|nr:MULTISPECIES: hypothetical protein [unclassified Campylobacter]MDA3079638.1 hypothetical protein [Campylobacter sp. CS_NA2]MDA3080930.1 hypothetical protein [Campylobacter sp. CS_NA1]MDA3085481.1 hypothetical protein [Campylobacter sp. CS_ED1]MDA3090470.1 hypothetical protein [Campylobacter sp. CS_ED2]WBR50748.1 hypothetical protein PF026_05170 [Campylobacter sp. CS_NA3]
MATTFKEICKYYDKKYKKYAMDPYFVENSINIKYEYKIDEKSNTLSDTNPFGFLSYDDNLQGKFSVSRQVHLADNGRFVIFRYFPHICDNYEVVEDEDGWGDRVMTTFTDIKINKDTKYFDFIMQELFKMNFQYYCGAWEIDKSGVLSFAVKIILEDNPLTPKLIERTDRLATDFLGDIEEIVYMLEKGKPMRKKPFESDLSNMTDENSI